MNTKWLIDAHNLWSDIMMLPHNGDMISSEEVEQAIKDAPKLDAVEVVHGKWVWDNRFHDYTCSICHNWDLKTPNYCSNCGAKMEVNLNGN